MNIQEEIDFVFSFLRDRYLQSSIISTFWGKDPLDGFERVAIDGEFIDHLYERSEPSILLNKLTVLIPCGNDVYLKCQCVKL